MRKIFLALAAVAAVGIAIPTFASNPAEARTVVVVKKKHYNHGRHLGWYKHGHHHHHGARVIVR